MAPGDDDSSGVGRPDSTRGIDTVDVTATEVARQAVQVFGDSIAPAAILSDSALPVDSSAAEPEMPTWDIDVRSYETHERVSIS